MMKQNFLNIFHNLTGKRKKHPLQEVLVIDDKPEKWRPLLLPEASRQDFILSCTASIEEGIEMLTRTPDSYDAVILGLTFAKSAMQGKEGLIKIRQINLSVPVIILSARNDDLQLVSECIRLGAYDFFSKAGLDPERLFRQVNHAIQMTKQKEKNKNLAGLRTDHHAQGPCFLHTRNDDKTHSFFAYRLDAVASAPSNNHNETEYHIHLAHEWHKDLLNTFSYYDPGVMLRLRYIANPEKKQLTTVIIIHYESRDEEEATQKGNEIRRELDIFFQPKNDFRKNIYFFSAITDNEELKKTLLPFDKGSFYQVVPAFTTFQYENPHTIGFNPGNNTSGETQFSFPHPDYRFSKLEQLFDNMLEQDYASMIEVEMWPEKLTPGRIGFLKDSFTYISESTRYTRHEKETGTKAISQYLANPLRCYHARLFLTQESGTPGRDMISSLSAGFFGEAGQVSMQKISFNGHENPDSPDEPHNSEWSSIYSPENITSIFRFPFPLSSKISGIRSIFPIFGFLPDNLSASGPVAGVKKINGSDKVIRIATEDLRKHAYILGQTGTGKTTLLYSMIMERIHAGEGVCVIDPHGDLEKRIYRNIPENRKNDIIRFEPGNRNNKIRINLLDYNPDFPEQKSYLIDELFQFFRQEYDSDTMGPMFELYMKNSLLLLMSNRIEKGSIDQVERVFLDKGFRNGLINSCSDRQVIDFWKEIAEKTVGESSLSNFAPYIISKLNQFLVNEYIKPIVSVKDSNIHFREIIDNGKILLVSLSKGKIGMIGMNILGTVILSRIINAAYSRENVAEEDRRDFTLFVDEFQNFTSTAILYAMSEARKYRLSLILANQTLGQLKSIVRESVLGNVGSTFFFRPGINDVDYIMPYFTPYLNRENALTLPNYRCMGRILVNHELSLPFIFETIEPGKLKQYLK